VLEEQLEIGTAISKSFDPLYIQTGLAEITTVELKIFRNLKLRFSKRCYLCSLVRIVFEEG
jgi:hypothetical protein